MAGKIQFTLNGEVQNFEGRISGKGSLKLNMDASALCLDLDYKSENKIVLKLSGEQGIKLSSSNKLKFTGSVSHDLVNRFWEGEYSLRLEISKSVAARLRQEFTKKGSKTTAEITIRF